MCIYLLCAGRFKLKFVSNKTNRPAHPKLGNKTFKKNFGNIVNGIFFRVQSAMTFKLPSLDSSQHEFFQYYIFTVWERKCLVNKQLRYL